MTQRSEETRFEVSDEAPIPRHPAEAWTPPAPARSEWAGQLPEPEPIARRSRLDLLRSVLAAFKPKSLTGRLVGGVVILLIIVVGATNVATYYALKPFLNNKLDQQVTSLTGPGSTISQGASAASGTSSGGVGSPTDVWAAFFTQSGQFLGSPDNSSKLHPLSLSEATERKLCDNKGNLYTVTNSDGTRLRARCVDATIDLTQFQQVHGVAIIGLSFADVQDTLHRLVFLEILIGLVAIIIAAGLTSWGVQVGLRPLKRVTRTAQEVTAELDPAGGGLDRRVPGHDAPTEVQSVASSMNTLLETVETEFQARIRSEQLMRQFLADASHELRTPLTSIRGYAELARLQGKTNDPDDPMHRIEIEGTRMSRLVEDLLVLARGEQDVEAKRELIDIDGVLADALTTVSGAHPERPMSMQADAGVTVVGDRDQLVRLFVNLLNNACVHTAPGGPIRMDTTLVTGEDGYPAVLVRVLDSGPGLSPEEAAHVFERFWRADKARSRAKGGTGLGMSIVAQIVATHGGQIRFDSAVETGTTVSVTLPTA